MFFHDVPEGPPDPVFGLGGAFQADVRPNKVDLMVGIYRDEMLEPFLLPSVKKAKGQILERDGIADYLPIDGFVPFYEELGRLLFGKKTWDEEQGRIYAAHATGGTGALRIVAEFLAQEVTRTIYIPDPTWPNHRQIFERAGCRVETYPYYNRQTKIFDCEAMCRTLETLPEKTAVLLHVSCHNPSGRDPSLDEWKLLSQVFKKGNLLPFFDCGYQGLGDGLDKDADSVRLFFREGHEMVVAYSCSKNFSLYCQRVGGLFVVDGDPAVKYRVGSQIKRIIRGLYSNPPAHGAKIVAEILQNGNLRKEWDNDLERMRNRIHANREKLISLLIAGTKKKDFHYLHNHKGLFMFIDLTKSQVQQLLDEWAIYVLDSGRINVAGLTQKNIKYVVEGLLRVTKS